MELPHSIWSTIDNIDPNLTFPYTDTADPRRTHDLKETELARSIMPLPRISRSSFTVTRVAIEV
jgi:hypothetical protein